MSEPELILYLGGTRSGKSAVAEAHALRNGGPVLYVATAMPQPDDPAMSERIRRHRQRRPDCWRLLECPRRLAPAVAAAWEEMRPDASGGSGQATILVDCVTLWVTNLLLSLPEQEDVGALECLVTEEVSALIDLSRTLPCRWIVVSGETGLGGIGGNALTRRFCDGLGLANQLLAARAQDAFLVVAGRLLRLAPAEEPLLR
ncbi:bifunctional adenosylcobinamide kinase/adenosylcobinamide-phosphate guanylyltransferase [uncultured Desulfovibrio sp.]|uniref:bifunctional adenosylcobinamide kinase/adenosylcobinamide-phosphate guanylyltransferase n=1 Tax=uncultured Desulfovibrio sp. TaxID=167968 RepID=UPI0026172D44|nr:bifunctional adenosylcobinamide kinase/adenosylcobinamide-phosphate guanylyltransferase [uncultured Desulfovibrio sp.]